MISVLMSSSFDRNRNDKTASKRCSVNMVLLRIQAKAFAEAKAISEHSNLPVSLNDHMQQALRDEIALLEEQRMNCTFANEWNDLEDDATMKAFCGKIADELMHDHDHIIQTLTNACDALSHITLQQPRSSVEHTSW